MDLDDDELEEERLEEKKWVDRVLQFGQYQTAKLLARGGMGAAFRVTVYDKSERALKLALPTADGEGDVFLKEARVITSAIFHGRHFNMYRIGIDLFVSRSK